MIFTADHEFYNRIMGRSARISISIGLAVILAFIAIASGVYAQADSAASQDLTTYLLAHRFPLVGASVTRTSGGTTQVILYGYVATEEGRQKAAARVATYYNNDPAVTIANRLTVDPEIRNLSANGSGDNTSAGAGAPDAGAVDGGTADSAVPAVPTYGQQPAAGGASDDATWEQVYQSIQKYGVHEAPDASNP